MTLDASQIEDLKRAYKFLEVPFTATALCIKKSYHRAARNWHPDYYPAGEARQSATRMMSEINRAYSQIAHAPLRYHIESYPRARERRINCDSKAAHNDSDRDNLPISDRHEYWARFFCGALLGTVTAFSVTNDLSRLLDYPNLTHYPHVLLVIVPFAISCGFASARYANRFWSFVLENWWQWW